MLENTPDEDTTMATTMRLALVVLLAALGSQSLITAQQPTDLFFSEYVEGTVNNKALEIYNGTGGAIDLAIGKYRVEFYFNGSPTAGTTINLTGTVAHGDVFVLAHSGATAFVLSQADQISSSNWFNGNDAIVLRKDATIVDVFGQVGFNPGENGWGTAPTNTTDRTLRRKPTVFGGDTNPNDVFVPSLEWDGFLVNTVNGLGSHTIATTVDAAPAVTSVVPANGASEVPPGTHITVTFSEPVIVAPDWFTLSCTTSGTVAATVTGGPTAYTIDPVVELAYAETCTLTIAAAAVADVDTLDPPDLMLGDFTSMFTTQAIDPCLAPFTPTYAIQGSGPTAAVTGTVSTMGIVVGDYEGAAPALRGFYIQDALGDDDPNTSDGLFIFDGSNSDRVQLGDLVRVTGNANEFQGQTQISASSISVCGTGQVEPTDVTFPVPSLDDLERYEGMLVRLPQTMYVTEHFQLGRFGQVVLSAGGRLAQPTAVTSPGMAAQAVQAANDLNRIILDDALQNQNPDPIVFARNGLPLSESNTLRGGDTATGIVGVMTFTWSGNAASGNAYRVRPINALGGSAYFEAANPRPATVPDVGGSLRVASANVLNYYNTFSACRAGVGGAAITCRGPEDVIEFNRQRAKTLAALLALNADVIGLIEIENDGYGVDSAIQDLVNGLNDATDPGTWAFIDADAGAGATNVLGSDGIRVALIYKPSVVTPVGQTGVINTGAFGLFELADGRIQGRNRPSLAQSFEIATGARFTVVVNHLISKGASCELNVSPVGPDGDTGDGQGACTLTRIAALEELTAWLATDPTGAGDTDYLLLGDFNAYEKEDPLAVLEAAGYTNLVPAFGGAGTYSYVFDGQWGSLDHAFASPSLAGQIAGAATYHINADEPSVLDYNTNFKSAAQIASYYAPNEFRASDHDPVVVGLDLNAVPTVSAGGPYTATLGQSLLLQATGSDPDGGPLTFEWDLDDDGSFETAGQNAVFNAVALGTFTVRVRATDTGGLSAVAVTTVTVQYAWDGFYAPIQNGPNVNVVRAGSAVPVKFSLGGDHGTDVLAIGFPLTLQVDCSTGAPGTSSPTGTAGGNVLTYDAAAGQYVYVWKTDRAWSGTCRRLIVQLNDGTMHDAMFQFR
jgi:uncharacterized protein